MNVEVLEWNCVVLCAVNIRHRLHRRGQTALDADPHKVGLKLGRGQRLIRLLVQGAAPRLRVLSMLPRVLAGVQCARWARVR